MGAARSGRRKEREILLLDADTVDRRLRSAAGATGPEIVPDALVSEEPANPWDRDAILVIEQTPWSADVGGATAPVDEPESVASVAFREVLARTAATDPVVEVDRRRLHGNPSIHGTRISVSLVLYYLAEGRTVRKILADFPGLTRQQVLGAVGYAARLLDQPVD